MSKGKILVSGAGIAGPSVAYWLNHHGFDVTVVERARELRPGGQAVDFRGEVHFSVLRKMGVLEAIQAKRTRPGGGLDFVDVSGKSLARMNESISGGELEIRRGDLSRILHEATAADVEYRFGESIASIEGTQVRFASGARAEFDVIIGADGLHSNVRGLVFGDEARFIKHLGYYVCIFDADPALNRERPVSVVPGENVCFNEPGRAAGFGDGQCVMFFASPELPYDPYDTEAQKRLIERAVSGMAWHVPVMLEHLRRAKDFYFDSISQVQIPGWWKDRTVLLGDAGYGGTLGGMGSGLAVVCSYVLAGELATAATPETAFQNYSEAIGAFARQCQKGAADVGKVMAPKTRWGIRLRNLTLRAFAALPGRGALESLLMGRATGLELKTYG